VARRLLTLAVVLVAAGGARAHPLAPSLLEVRELPGGRAAVRWKLPRLRVPAAVPAPVLPARCREVGPRRRGADGRAEEVRWEVDCGGGLVGERIGVAGLARPVTTAVVRVVLADGRVVRAVVTPENPSVRVPARPRWWDVARTYGRLGVVHILSGPDHLLFVLGLVLLSTSARRIAVAVTAFTAGHSLTLAAAALGIVRLPAAPIEVAIAGSVFVLAVELARERATPTLLRRRPWVMAGLFGLLHGLGFAAALAEAGLPAGDVPLALLAFNLGVEAGQALFVATVLALGVLAAPALARGPAWHRRVPVYAMGSLAALWWIERTVALLAWR
jgi:hydrogenase/urease accessory protein HupE